MNRDTNIGRAAMSWFSGSEMALSLYMMKKKCSFVRLVSCFVAFTIILFSNHCFANSNIHDAESYREYIWSTSTNPDSIVSSDRILACTITLQNSCASGSGVSFTHNNGNNNGIWAATGGTIPAVGTTPVTFTPGATSGCFSASYNGGGCSSTQNFLIFPAAPILTSPANTCATAFTLPTLPNIVGSNGATFTAQFSIDGAAYLASPAIPTSVGCHSIQARYVLLALTCGFAAGTSAPVGCAASNTVNVIIFPAAPSISAPTNTCASMFTLPTVASVGGFSVEYRIDGGTWSASPSTTTPGCHTVQARYALSSLCGSGLTSSPCSSNIVSVVIFPTAPTVSAISNTCNSSLAGITAVTTISQFTAEYAVQAPGGSLSAYGTLAAANSLFTNTPGCWTIKARYYLTNACGSTAANSVSTNVTCQEGTTNAVVFPSAPSLAAIANTCNAALTGIAAVSDLTARGFTSEYAVQAPGGSLSTYGTLAVANSLLSNSPGCWTIKARYKLTSACGSSPANSVSTNVACQESTINAVVFPSAPVIAMPVNSCAAMFTFPTVTAVSGFNIEYSINGGSSWASNPSTNTPGCYAVLARYVLAANCGLTILGTTGNAPCGSSNSVNVVIYPPAPSAPTVNLGCGPIIVTPPPSIAGFNIEFSFDDGATWGPNTPPTADNCTGYKIKTRYVTSGTCGSIPAGTASTVAGCIESPATVRAIDSSFPVLSGVPPNTVADCASVPTPATVTATSPCSMGSLPVVSASSTVAGSCAGNYTITRTWTATNTCGNATTGTQVITVTDITGPVLVGVPANTTANCSSVPAAATVTATDNCSSIPLGVIFTTSTVPGSCPGNYVVTRTWTATDQCGNSTSGSQTITVSDVTAPVISCPAAQTFCEVVSNTYSVPVLTASDNCSAFGSLTITYQVTGATTRSGSGTDASGLFNIGSSTVTWTVTDQCGNVSTCATTVTITQRPTATISYALTTFCVTNATIQNATLTGTGAYLGGNYSAAPGGLALNAITGAITPSGSSIGTYNVIYTTPASGGCPGIVSNTVVITITATPTVSIAYSGTPFCNNVAAPQGVTISGTGSYLGGVYSSTVGLNINSATGAITPLGSTPGNYVVTYMTPTGNCNSVSATTNITITALPTITSLSYAGSPYCATVNTPQSVTLTGTGIFTPGTYTSAPAGLSINGSTGAITPNLSSAGTYTVTYMTTPSAGCGSVSVNTSVTITAAPTATISYGTPLCPSSGNANVTLTGTMGGTYSSTAGLTINAATGQITPNTSTPGTYIVTYIMPAANGCPSAQTTTSVTIGDTTMPTITVPANVNIECSASSLPANTGQATATDNCTLSPSITYSDVIVNGNCVNRYTITRTWTATDANGNTKTGTQTITVGDTTSPVISCPANITVATPDNIPAVNLALVNATDNCPGTVTISLLSETFVLAGIPGFCPTQSTRVFMATDACGNTATCSQIITISDVSNCGYCQGTVPFYIVDLSPSPTTSVTLLNVARNGLCCLPIDQQFNCVSFNIFLNSDAVGVTILVDGATPSPQDWELDCIPVSINNGVVCIPGGAFYTFTYCKPGNNVNNFTFTSIGGAIGSANIVTRIGCSTVISVSGVTAASVVFTDITPGGSQGTLTPMTGSLTATFIPGPSTPPVVKYQVCGTVVGGICASTADCDTITINVFPPIVLTVTVPPNNCLNNPPTITTSVSPAGTYVYEWHSAGNGGGGILPGSGSTHVINAAGTYSVIAIDNTTGILCNRDTTNFTVTFDVTNPVVTPPANLTLQCNNPNNATLISNWLDMASAVDAGFPLTVTNNYATFTQTCGLVRTITFSASDACGNIGTATATITIIDTTPPNIICPSQVNVSCASSVPAAATNYATFVAAGGSASDLCLGNPVITWISDVPNMMGCPNNVTITRTYMAADGCGNTATCSQSIIVNNSAAPIVPANGNSTVQCVASAVVPTPPVVNDACGSPLTPTMTVGPNPVCEGSKVYTFTYTTCIGLSATWTYTYIIAHITAPVVPANGSLTVACVANAVAPTTPAVTDVCGAAITPVLVSTVNSPVSLTCEGTRVYTYSYTDCSNLTTNWTYTYTIDHTIAPVVPANGILTVECLSAAIAPTLPVVIDQCALPSHRR